MTDAARTTIECPVCGSHGTRLHHDIRASLLYSCMECLHEWKIEPADEPPDEADATISVAVRTHDGDDSAADSEARAVMKK